MQKKALVKIIWEDPDVYFSKDFKAAIVINVFQEIKETMCKEIKLNMAATSYQIENIGKKIKI